MLTSEETVITEIFNERSKDDANTKILANNDPQLH